MSSSTIESLWGLLQTEEGRRILLEEGKKTPRLLVQNLQKLSVVNREARDAVGRFTRNPKVQNIFYTVFYAEFKRINTALMKPVGISSYKKITPEAYEIFLEDLLKLKAGLVGWANAYGGRFQNLLDNVDERIKMEQDHKRRMAWIQRVIDEVKSEGGGGGTVEEGEIDKLESEGGGTAEDGGDILNEVDGNFTGRSTRIV